MKRLRWVLPVAVVVVAAVILAWVYLAAPPTPRLERMIPGDAILYVHYQGFEKAAKPFEGTSIKALLGEEQVLAFRAEAGRVLADFMAGATRGSALTPKDLRMFLDCEFSLAVYPGEGDRNEIVLAVDPGTQADLLREAVKALQAEADGRVVKRLKKEIEGVPVMQTGDAHVAWFENILLVATGESSMRRAILCELGKSSSIATDELLVKMRERTKGSDGFLSIHLRADRALDQLKSGDALTDEQRKTVRLLGLESFKCVHLNVLPEPPGIRSFLYLYAPDAKKGLVEMLPVENLDEERVLAQVPANASAAFAARWDAAKAYDLAADLFAAMGNKTGFDERIEEMRKKLNVDPRRDLLSTFDDEVVVAVTDLGETDPVDAFVAVRLKDRAGALSAVEKIAPVGEDGWNRSEHKGADLFVSPGVAGNEGAAIAVGGGRLVLGSTRKAAVSTLDATNSLGADADFREQRKHLPAEASTVCYVDVRTLVEKNYPKLVPALKEAVAETPPFLGLRELTRMFLSRLPKVDALSPHLFGSIATLRRDGEGFMLEGYGPLGGSLNPVGPVPVMMETLAGIYLVPPLNRARESACRAACMNNTRQLMLALRRYAMDHNDNYPDSFGDLLKKGYITTTKVFFCPSSGHSIPADFPTDFKDADLAELRKIDELSDYLMVPYATASFPPSFVVVYEKDNHRGEGRNLGFNDGHVDWQTGEELRETITRQISEAKKMGWPQEYVDKMVSSLEVILEQTNP